MVTSDVQGIPSYFFMSLLERVALKGCFSAMSVGLEDMLGRIGSFFARQMGKLNSCNRATQNPTQDLKPLTGVQLV